MTTTVDDAALKEMIAAERLELADLLGGLPAEDWDRPSLCAGWRVREVVAHMTMPFRYSTPRFIVELVRARGRFNVMADRSAQRDGAQPIEALVSTLGDNAHYPWKPPGGGFEGALVHDVIHGLDITVALGLGRVVPENRLRIVMHAVSKPKTAKYFGADLRGVALQADDLDWSLGSGAPVAGPAQELALVLCGRRLPARSLRGDQRERFSAA